MKKLISLFGLLLIISTTMFTSCNPEAKPDNGTSDPIEKPELVTKEFTQQDFVIELFRECKRLGFHTALDTAGSVAAKQELLELTDLCLLDVKYTTDEAYKQYTGGSLQQTLSFLQQLQEASVDTVIRQVIVPGRNDTTEAMDALCELLSGYSCIQKIELLPFRNLCIEKYEAMGIPFPLQEAEQALPERINELQAYCEKLRI